MQKYNIPTAAYAVFTEPDKAKDYVRQQELPVVLKADGLAAGKGVVIAQNQDEAMKAVEDILEAGVFGAAGNRLVEMCIRDRGTCHRLHCSSCG